MPRSKFKEKAERLRAQLNESQPTIDNLTRENKRLTTENEFLYLKISTLSKLVETMKSEIRKSME